MLDAAGDFALQQREKKIFLALEVGVEGAAGVAGLGGDFLEFGGLESVACKDFFGGLDQPGARDLRAFLAARYGGGRLSFILE